MALAKLWIVFATISCFVLLTEIKGVQAQLKFLTAWGRVLLGRLGRSVVLDCTTNDPNATVELFHMGRKLTVQPGVLTNVGGLFTIIKATVRSAGLYTCKAANQAGSPIQKLAPLILSHVTSPDYEQEPKDVQIRKVGESVQFKITAEVVFPSKISWMRHVRVGGKDTSLPITAQHNITHKKNSDRTFASSSLTLKNLQLDDCCDYEAIATYDDKDEKFFFTVLIFAPTKPVIDRISAESTTSESKDKKFKCDALGYPPPDLEWFKDGVKIPPCKKDCSTAHYVQSDTHKSANKSEGTLKITGITYSDAGVYKCKATNIHGSGEATTRLTVQTRPYIFKHGSNQVSKSYREGTQATVECRVVRSEPLPTFTWLYQDYKGSAKNNNGNSCKDLVSAWLPLPSSITYSPPLNQTSKGSTINIPSDLPPPGHAACYKCQATNQFGNDSLITELHRYKFTEKELLRIKPNKLQELNAGETLKLQCFLLLGSISPYSVRWQRNGVDLDDGSKDPRIKHKFTFVANVSDIFDSGQHAEIAVAISNLTANDSGHYSCKVAGDNLNKTVNVVVKAIEPPKVSWKKAGTEKMTVYENNATSLKLQCILEKGNPKPEFSWFRNNEPLHPKDSENANCNLIRDGWYFTGSNKREIVICGKPLKYETFYGRYTCTAKNEEGEDSIDADLNILAPAKILEPAQNEPKVVLSLSHALNRTCRARGNPQPKVQWWRGSELIKEGTGRHGVRLVIESASESDFGNYSCVAENWHTDQRFFLVEQAPGVGARGGGDLATDAIIGLVVACLVFVLLVTLITYLVWRRQKRKMDLYYMRAGMNNYEIDPDRSILEQVNDMPYDLDWEFREDRLILGKTIGSGAFGQVVKAEAIGILAFNPRDKTSDAFKRRSKIRRSVKYSKMEQDPQNWKFAKTTVAVKMLKDNAGEGEYRDLASEIKIMIHIGEHRNIINILGACTQAKKLLLIMEFAVHGSLLQFLRERRPVYRPTWTKTVNDPKQEYTLVDVVMAAYQISRGLEFLASKKCIHRDVAARNVLIGEGYTMKIADFGLARDIYKNDEYVKTTSGLLPVKWMALESLFDRTYTEKSDVWAFGIVLWEIMTLGGTPYPGLPTENLLDFLTEGRRMTQPDNCPLEVYTIMRDCWQHDPESRPHFQQLAEHLGKILEKNVTKDNPYIIVEVEETQAGNNYYLNPVDDPRLSRHQPSTSGYYESPSPLNFEPIDTPKSATKDESRGYDSPLPTLPPSLPDQEPDNNIADYPLPLPPVPPTYDEALQGYEEDSAVREKAQLAAEEERKMAQAAGREGSKSSADEGIGLDENGQLGIEDEEGHEPNERSKLLTDSRAPAGNNVEMTNVDYENTRFLPKSQCASRISMESTV